MTRRRQPDAVARLDRVVEDLGALGREISALEELLAVCRAFDARAERERRPRARRRHSVARPARVVIDGVDVTAATRSVTTTFATPPKAPRAKTPKPKRARRRPKNPKPPPMATTVERTSIEPSASRPATAPVPPQATAPIPPIRAKFHVPAFKGALPPPPRRPVEPDKSEAAPAIAAVGAAIERSAKAAAPTKRTRCWSCGSKKLYRDDLCRDCWPEMRG